MSQTDLQGETLAIGDRVAVMKGGQNPRLYLAIVTRFTAKKLGVMAEKFDFVVGNDERLIEGTSCVKISNQQKKG